MSNDILNFNRYSKCVSKQDCESHTNSVSCGILPGCHWVAEDDRALFSFSSGVCSDNGDCKKYSKEDCMSEQQKRKYEQLMYEQKDRRINGAAKDLYEARQRHKQKYGDICFGNDGPTGCEEDEFCTKDHYIKKSISHKEGNCLKKLDKPYMICMKSSLVENNEYDVECEKMYCVLNYKVCIPKDKPVDKYYYKHFQNYPTCLNSKCNAFSTCEEIANVCTKNKSTFYK